MTSDQIATALDDAKCVDTCIPQGMGLSVLVALFAQIAGVAVDTNQLLDDAKCVDTCIPPGSRMSVLISLAQQIVDGGGTGGGLATIDGAGSPVGTATPSGKNQFYRDTNAPGALWISTGTLNTQWLQIA